MRPEQTSKRIPTPPYDCPRDRQFWLRGFHARRGKCESPTDKSSTWVEFGGDVSSQAVYCCGDHSRQPGETTELDGYTLPLQKDPNFFNFLRLLNAHRDKEPTGGPCYDCFFFIVTPTFTGRFFSGGWAVQKQGQASQGAGYGHLGCCSMLVVERVTDIETQRTRIPEASRFRCRKRTWIAKTPQRDVLFNPNSSIDRNDPSGSGAYAIRKIAKEWGISVPDTDSEIFRDVSKPKCERAHGTWTSADKTVKFSIELKTRGEVDPTATGPARSEWVPQKITGETCTATQP